MTFSLRGKVSWFGGPADTGVSPSEGLAFIYSVADAPHLFLPAQPSGTTGLARRLDPEVFYVACRWDYAVYPKPSLLQHKALVRSTKTGKQFVCSPADWGPHQDTGRVADISSGLMAALGIQTDDEVEVIYPYGEQEEIAVPTYNSIVISSGHGKIVRGAAGPSPWGLDEVNEARRVVDSVAAKLHARGVATITYHDDQSATQNENLNRIVDFHNSKTRDLDVSVHFNAYQVTTSKPMGTECLYVTQQTLAAAVSNAIASVGFVNRGPKKRTDLFFLNNTSKPAVLIETCFVDSQPDADLYRARFDQVCEQIATALSGVAGAGAAPTPPETTPPEGTTTPPAELPRVEITVVGDVLVFVNGEQVGTKG